MRRIATLLGTAAIAALPLAVGSTAEARTASPAAFVYYKSYTQPDVCAEMGYGGEQAHQWTAYYCLTVYPAGWDSTGQYDLYVQY